MMNLEPGSRSSMTSIMSKAATMEIPINSNGDTRTSEDDSLEQIHWSLERKDLQQVMVSGPNLNETSIVSGGYGGSAEGIIPTGSIKELRAKSRDFPPCHSAAARISCQPDHYPAPSMHHSHSNPSMMSEEATRGIAVEKFDSVKKWSINTYKCTKQMFSERFGRGSRTVDLELEAQIDVLRETKQKYEHVLRLAQALTTHFYNVVQTQQALGDTFADLSQKSPELQDEFGYNAETQKLLCKNGETLLGAINFFVSSINTLVNKTMEDTLMTIKMYENARLDRSTRSTETSTRLRSDVTIKLKFLEENKVKVMHKQLLLFHNAISAYFAGNQQQLEQTLRQFNVKLKRPGSDRPSWLEEQ
ncbi:hypothetical protein AMELA_G00106300 [Ameiurus melas]|uniref:AH domain-containing protein n=1 Tax=Ameiurus melas TaxID=219545 RepID=A0A7J6AW78_AMEME|nr:hypothetical protein AMELA_G00106300 [Ameiurus melas]